MQVVEHLNTLGKWGHTDPRVFQLIRHSGFEHFLNLPFQGIQHPVQLLTVLLKGYTLDSGFVFGNEKFSLTLEDVLYVTGLPIDGHPVAVTDVSASTQDTCMKYLGAHLPMKGTHVCLTSLKKMFETVPSNANAETVEWHARAKLLYIIGCVLCPNKDSTVSVQFLPFLANLEEVHHYAWGAALLSYLMSSLEPKGKSVKGCAQLLVIFFLMRVKPIREKITPELIAKEFPLLKACTTSISVFCRRGENMRKDEWDNILSNLEDTDVEWRPYGSIILPPHLTEQLRIARCRTALICLETVMVQRPDISPKQFGFEEEDIRGGFAPANTINTKAKRGRKTIDGSINQAIENWMNRLNLFAFVEGASHEAQESEALPQQFESLRLDCDCKEKLGYLKKENVFLIEKCNSLQEYSSSIFKENQSLLKENRNLMNQIHDLKELDRVNQTPVEIVKLLMVTDLVSTNCFHKMLNKVQACGSIVTEEQPHAMLIPMEYFFLGHGLCRPCHFSENPRSPTQPILHLPGVSLPRKHGLKPKTNQKRCFTWIIYNMAERKNSDGNTWK